MAIENGQRKGTEWRSEADSGNRRPLRYVVRGALLGGAIMVGAACGGSARQTPAPEMGYTEMKATTGEKMQAEAEAIPVTSSTVRQRGEADASTLEPTAQTQSTARERIAQIVDICRDSANAQSCVIALTIDPQPVEIKVTEGRRTGSTVVSEGDVLFSGTYGEYILKMNVRLRVSGVEQDGVSFEIRRTQTVDVNAAEEAGIELTPEEIATLRQANESTTTSSFRINFDGTCSGGAIALHELGLEGITVERAEDGQVRVTLPPLE